MQDFKKLRVWHLARDLSVKVIEALPPGVGRKVPGLRAQAIRAVTSIPANLAEGCSRATRAEFLSFVKIAIASANELEAHLLLARDAGVLTDGTFTALMADLNQVRRMLIALMRTLERRLAEDLNRSPGSPESGSSTPGSSAPGSSAPGSFAPAVLRPAVLRPALLRPALLPRPDSPAPDL